MIATVETILKELYMGRWAVAPATGRGTRDEDIPPPNQLAMRLGPLEHKILALGELAPLYVYLSMKAQVFTRLHPCRSTLVGEVELTPANREWISIIRDALAQQRYDLVLRDYPIRLPWSDCILPNLSPANTLPRKVASSVSNVMLCVPSLRSIMERACTGAVMHDDEVAVRHAWVGHTHAHAPSINGLACGGKSTLLRDAHELVCTRYDSNASILKVSQFGSFRGKDVDQVLAMQYQFLSIHLTLTNYTSIMDRCPFNNMLWRLIMKYVDTTIDPIDAFVKDLSRIHVAMIEAMSREPVMILLEAHIDSNRRRMWHRNTGQDRRRATIERYVSMQNMVYGTFARLCNWPTFQVAETLKDNGAIMALIRTKIAANLSAHGNKKPPPLEVAERHETTYPVNDETEYGIAKAMGIFK